MFRIRIAAQYTDPGPDNSIADPNYSNESGFNYGLENPDQQDQILFPAKDLVPVIFMADSKLVRTKKFIIFNKATDLI